jgi:hypothetical protein
MDFYNICKTYLRQKSYQYHNLDSDREHVPDLDPTRADQLFVLNRKSNDAINIQIF